MARIPRKDEREYCVELFDGRAMATVYEVDGYGRPVTEVFFDNGPVRTREDAIAEYERARAAGVIA